MGSVPEKRFRVTSLELTELGLVGPAADIGVGKKKPGC